MADPVGAGSRWWIQRAPPAADPPDSVAVDPEGVGADPQGSPGGGVQGLLREAQIQARLRLGCGLFCFFFVFYLINGGQGILTASIKI